MSIKSNSHFDSLSAMTALLNDAELRALADKCQNLIADREHVQREELRQDLMRNLQKAIEDILHNGFELTIANTARKYINGHGDAWFQSNDIDFIEIEIE